MIRIDAIRELRRDLHMRPFESDRRVYLIFSADLMNDDAADALLKDLEEPPSYAVIVLVADELGPIERDDPFALPARPVPAALGAGGARRRRRKRAPELDEQRRTALARVAAGGSTGSAGCSTRRRPAAARRCSRRPAPCTAQAFEPNDAAVALLASARECGAQAKKDEEDRVQALELTAREAEQRVRRAQRGAEREELLAQLEELAAWYRDLVVVAVGAEQAAVHVDRLDDLRADASRERMLGAERAAEAVRETWRRLEEFNLAPQLALEAMFVRLERELHA